MLHPVSEDNMTSDALKLFPERPVSPMLWIILSLEELMGADGTLGEIGEEL